MSIEALPPDTGRREELTLLQRAPFPDPEMDVPRELYFRAANPQSWRVDLNAGLRFDKALSGESDQKSEQLSFDTFFGAFSLTSWCGPAGINRLVIVVEATGTATIRVWHDNGIEPRFQVAETDADGNTRIAITIDRENSNLKQGILYPEFIAGHDAYLLSGLSYHSLQTRKSAASVAIVMPTFKREDYVRRNIAIIQDHVLTSGEGRAHLYVIDNGRTLGGIDGPGISVVRNPNYGGSGGYARGVIEAIRSGRNFTHVLYCDDDILIEPEAIRRAICLAEFLDDHCIIPGGMIDFGNRGRLHELGARQAGFDLRSVKGGLDLTNPANVADFDRPEFANYYGWWFVIYPLKLLQDQLPPPFFVGWDDILHGLLLRSKVEVATLCGVAVWHEEFYKKDANWRWYYQARNGLITHFAIDSAPLWNHFRNIFGCLMTYRYERAEYLLRGTDDAMKGPDFLRNLAPDQLHDELVAAQKFSLQAMSPLQIDGAKFNANPTHSWVKLILAMFSLNGHLLPPALMRDAGSPASSGWVAEPLHTFRLAPIFRCPVVVYYEPSANLGIVCRIDRARFFALFARLCMTTLRLAMKRPGLVKLWRAALPGLMTIEFWTQYLRRADPGI